MGIAAWAAGGGVAASQERRGGGDAVTEAGGASSQPGGRESVATSHSPPHRPPRSSSEDGRVGTEQQTRAADKQHPQHKRMEWRRHRPLPGAAGGGAGSGSRGGRREDGTRSCDERAGIGMDDGARESLGSRKRRTPSPDTEIESRFDEDAPAWRKGSGGGGGGLGEADDPHSSLIRWCKRVANPPLSAGGTSGASSGDEEKFFAGRVLEPVPRRRPIGGAFGTGEGWVVEPDSPVSRSGGGRRWDSDSGGGDCNGGGGSGDGGSGGGSGGGGGGGVGDDAEASAVRRRGGGTAQPAKRNNSASGAQCSVGVAAAVAADAGATPIAAGGGASPSPSNSDGTDATSHRGGGESFFARHALEPSPRPGWNREAFVDGGAKESVARAVANGIVVHALAEGIGTHSAGRSSGTPLLPGEVRGSSSEFGVTPSPPPAAVGTSAASGRIGQALRSASAVRAWSTKPEGEEWRDGAAAQMGATATTPMVAPVEETAALDTNSGEWEVQPEAMAAFFTTVVGVDPPVTTMAGRRAAKPPAPPPLPPLPPSSLRSAQRPLRHARRLPFGTPATPAASSSGGGISAGDTAAAVASSAVAVSAAAGATTATAAAAGGAADTRTDSGESCSMSIWTDSGIGGGEGNSWGW